MIIFRGICSLRGIVSWPLTNRGLTPPDDLPWPGVGGSVLLEAAGTQNSGPLGLPCALQKPAGDVGELRGQVLWSGLLLTNIMALV